MRNLFRVLHYVKIQYKLLILSFVFAFLTTALFSLSIAAMLPLMKVIIGEEGPQGWINRAIVKHRSGITIKAEELQEIIPGGGSRPAQRSPLLIQSIKKNSPAWEKGLKENDIILSVAAGPDLEPESLDRDQLLDKLARINSPDPVQLSFRPLSGNEGSLSLRLKTPPWYTPAAYSLLKLLPPQHDPHFKQKCIELIIILMLIATIFRCLFRFGHEYLVNRITFRSLLWIRLEAYRTAVRLPLSYFSTKGVSDTMSRFLQDTNRISSAITTVFGKAVREPIQIIILAIIAFSIDVWMTLIVITGVPIAGIILHKLSQKMKKATRRALESWSKMLGRLQGTFLGIKIVKGYHQEEFEERSFRQVNERLLKQQLRMAKIDAASGPALEALGIGAACVGMIFAANWMLQGNMATSDFFTLVLLLGTMAESGRKLGDIIPRIQTANASADRVYALIDTPAEADPPAAVELGRLSHSLEFRRVCFSYPDNPNPALVDINLTVRVGQTVAVVGPNGSGKTTLLNMIPRFFIPDEGQVLIDGVDIAQVTLQSLRRQIGIVTQQTVVFNDSIAANIAYGNQQATQQEIIAAAQQAYAHEFIEKTADGYQTIIGEQGMTLSGGQLQRLAIARAILRDPAILIFDEAMSQIDADSEVKIQKALADFARHRTSFIIAHRLSTVIDADLIVVLDRGRLVACGDHHSLLQQSNIYRQLYEIQLGPV